MVNQGNRGMGSSQRWARGTGAERGLGRGEVGMLDQDLCADAILDQGFFCAVGERGGGRGARGGGRGGRRGAVGERGGRRGAVGERGGGRGAVGERGGGRGAVGERGGGRGAVGERGGRRGAVGERGGRRGAVATRGRGRGAVATRGRGRGAVAERGRGRGVARSSEGNPLRGSEFSGGYAGAPICAIGVSSFGASQGEGRREGIVQNIELSAQSLGTCSLAEGHRYVNEYSVPLSREIHSSSDDPAANAQVRPSLPCFQHPANPTRVSPPYEPLIGLQQANQPNSSLLIEGPHILMPILNPTNQGKILLFYLFFILFNAYVLIEKLFYYLSTKYIPFCESVVI